MRIDQARDQPWQPGEQSQIAQDMAEGLAYLHGLAPPVLHRDVKPSNVLLVTTAGTLHAKLCDFGLALLRPLEATHVTVPTHLHGGSPRYMAPETLVAESGRQAERSC